jgi:ubiquinone/menaquinone biosynthesis C-methylase UbiE
MADAREEEVWTNHARQQYFEMTKPAVPKAIDIYVVDYNLKNKFVVDYGCGTGFFSTLFNPSLFLGLDQNAKMIEYARQRNPLYTYQTIDWQKIALIDECVDVIFTSYVLQHNLLVDKDPIYKEFYRVLRPGGLYICIENTFRLDNFRISFPKLDTWQVDLTDGYSYTAEGWRKLLSQYRFKCEQYSSIEEYVFRKE